MLEAVDPAVAASNPIENATPSEHDIPNVIESKNGDVSSAEDKTLHSNVITLFLIIIALMLSMFLIALDMSIIATAIPRITAEFHSLADVGWYGSAFFMCLAAFVSFWGKTYKHFPIKTTFLSSIFIFELGSLICGVARSSTTLIVGRAIQGAGGAGVTSGCYIIVAFSVRPPKVPAITGLFGVVFSIASVAGPLLGGVLTERVSWRWCFYINLPVGGAALVILSFLYRTPAHAKPVHITRRELFLTYDIPGTVTIIAALLCYFLTLEWGGITKNWNSADVIGTLVGWISFTILFVVIQWWQGERGLVVPRILKQRNIAGCCAFIFCLNSAGFARTYNLPIYFQAVDGVSPSESGIRSLPTVLAISLFTFVGSSLVGKLGYFQPFLTVGSAVALVGSGLVYTLDIGSTPAEFIGYQVVAGIGMGLALQVPLIVAQSRSAKADISCTVATVLFFQSIGGAVGVATGQSIFTNRLIQSLPIQAPGVEAAKVLAVGVTGLRDAFTASQLQGILKSYIVGLKAEWAWSIALSGMSLLVSFIPEWKTIKAKDDVVGDGAASSVA